MLASSGLFASEGCECGVFADDVCPGFGEAQERNGEAFVNGGQLKCENTELGIECWSKWR